MRLTEKPKPLAEMKGDVAWSPQVQQVLDRALERGAEARYQTAGEFGRELTTAIKGMRDSTATKAFTSMMSPQKAVPPTRMSEPSLPPTRVSTATPHSGTPTSKLVPKKSRTPMLAAAAVVLAIGVAGTYFALNGRAANTGVPQTAAPQGAGDTSRAATTPAPAAPQVNLQRELEEISPLSSDTLESVARQALARLERIDSVARLADDTSLLQFRFLRGRAMMNAGMAAAGCDSLKNIEGRIRSTRFHNSLQPLLLACAAR